LAQVLGASLGYGILMLITPEEIFFFPEGGTCVTLLHDNVSVTQGFFVEFLLTFALVMMICAVWNTCGGESAPLRIGLTVATLCFAGAPFTDASLNPARSFG
jgi:glycerol uptake facilitator-like aquaporin